MLIAFKHYDHTPDASNWVIRQWTGSPFVHVELVLESLHNTVIAARTADDGVWFYPFEEMIRQPEYFEFYRVPGVDEQAVLQFLQHQAGKPFNWLAVLFRQGLGLDVAGSDHWFCSELAYYVLAHFSTVSIPRNLDPKSLTPGRLRDLVALSDAQRVPSSEFARLPDLKQNPALAGLITGLVAAASVPVLATPAAGSGGGGIQEVPVAVNFVTGVENEVAFPWNGRRLIDYVVTNTSGQELPGVVIERTPTGFKSTVDVAFTGTVRLYLFTP